MLTFVDTHHVRLILSEVERLAGVNFVADRVMKVHVIDHSIAVCIESFEDMLKLLVS